MTTDSAINDEKFIKITFPIQYLGLWFPHIVIVIVPSMSHDIDFTCMPEVKSVVVKA